MTKQLEYIMKAVLLFKNISEEAEFKDKEKPLWLRRRVLGSIVGLFGVVSVAFFGREISPEVISSLTNNLEVVVGGVVAIWGTVLTIVGHTNKKE